MSSKSRIPKYLKRPFLLSFLLTSLMFLVVLIFYFRIQPQIPLFYSLARPSQHLASKNWLLLLPSLSLLIGFTHLMITKKSAKKTENLLMKLFAWTTVAIQLVLGLALFRILAIIT